VRDKGLGLAVHYRGASSSVIRRTRPIIDEVLGIVGPQIHLMQGHKVWEFLPHQIDGKRGAVRALLSTVPPGTLPIFVGDDITDEKAFGVIPHGLTIHVGVGRRTNAHFLLRNPKEVHIFLLKLEAEIV
jgi:trehalose 6-phosphate phosphatase